MSPSWFSRARAQLSRARVVTSAFALGFLAALFIVMNLRTGGPAPQAPAAPPIAAGPTGGSTPTAVAPRAGQTPLAPTSAPIPVATQPAAPIIAPIQTLVTAPQA